MARRVTRAGAATIGLGVLVDVPPHVLQHDSLETLALAGHLAVLAGMVIVLVGLILVATSSRSQPRRLP